MMKTKDVKKFKNFHINGENHMNLETGLVKEFHISNEGWIFTIKKLQILYRILKLGACSMKTLKL